MRSWAMRAWWSCAKPSMDAREAGAARIQERTGATYISPYNDAAVMSGQGTMALELLEQARACGKERCGGRAPALYVG